MTDDNASETSVLVLAAESSRKRFTLQNDMLVGREPSCDIPINSLHISRQHARITQTPTGFFLEDLNSANGTYINGLKLTTPVALQIGDLVCFDDQGFRVVAEGRTEPDSQFLSRTGAAPIITEAQIAAVSKPVPVEEEQSTRIQLDEAAAMQPEPISLSQETSALDTTRTLTYHEMKQLLNWSHALEETAQAAKLEPRFIVQTAPLAGKVIPLQALDVDTRWKIGSDLTSKICLRDNSILVDHAYVARNPSGFRLTATSAAKSFLLNGIPLRDSYLRHGDNLQIGRIKLEYRTDATLAEPEATPMPVAQTNGKQTWLVLVTLAVIALALVFALVVRK
jgi:pSer/pThr/pTyr-binding forkhead associated (FHA) protein